MGGGTLVSDHALPPLDTIAAAHELLTEGRPFSAHKVYACWKQVRSQSVSCGRDWLSCAFALLMPNAATESAHGISLDAQQRLETYAVTDGPTTTS
jgi:hypothetical protein